MAGWRESRQPPWRYEAATDCEERVHRLIGAAWPCQELQRWDELWRSLLDELAARGFQVGRGAFGGWDDGDPRLGRLAWCLARHLRPERVVETGVARGLTTRMLLEALERNARGRLWSIDLPPLLEHQLARETAVAVPDRLYPRWTLLRGSSRRRLRRLVTELGQIDLFVHDSMHTTRNVQFELDQVWPVLATKGAAVIDDVERNAATGRFVEAHRDTPAVLCPSDDNEALIACLIKAS
jgi:predicted O-methyltransferase YrrM